MEIDLELGDVILAGKFKNKRKIVKNIGKDNLGQPTINGMKALNFRIEKLMPKDKWSKKSKEALEFAEEVNEVKVTKRQLRRIIKEEKLKLLREAQAQEEALFSALDQYVMALDEEMGYDVPTDQLKAEVLNFVDGYFEDTA
tara:strand:+ start:677 stop:1102 length:426 start_codon:yes stop_codon:yes gene_type:complete